MELKEYVRIISDLSDDQLINLKVDTDAELARRGIKLNVGDRGEKLTIGYFNSTSGLPNLLQAPTGAKNVDALSRDGDRYSIKTFMKAKKTGTIYPDNEDRDKQLFEYLVIARLDDNYQLDSIYRYTWNDFTKVRAWDRRMNAWYVPLSHKNLKLAEVIS